jgi:beta-glucosidase
LKYKFPKNFLWGAAVAAHQVEGNLKNDWTRWEDTTSKEKAKNAKKEFKMQADALSKFDEKVWKRFEKRAANPSNYLSGKAIDFEHRYKEDIEIVKKLSLNSFRFSIEWSRIEPQEGKFSREGIEFYRKILTFLKSTNITPIVTLWHFTSPIWFADKGGFEKKENIRYFERFAKRMVEEFGTLTKYWITLNEPVGYVVSAYSQGIFPPNKKNPILMVRVYRNYIKAHRRVYDIIKSISPDAQVSIAKHNIWFEAADNFFLSKIIVRIAGRYSNQDFLEKIKDKIDFIGLNFYNTQFIDRAKVGFFLKLAIFGSNSEYKPAKIAEGLKRSDMGWYLNPKAFYNILMDLKHFNKPIIITEHGIADSEDTERADFIRDSLVEVHKTIREGLDVRGYMYWSLTDNFEWDKGFWPQFGLVAVDLKNNFKRSIKKSAFVYKKIAEQNGL